MFTHSQLKDNISQLTSTRNTLLLKKTELENKIKQQKPQDEKTISELKSNMTTLKQNTLVFKDALPRRISVPLTQFFYPKSIPQNWPKFEGMLTRIHHLTKESKALQEELDSTNEKIEKINMDLTTANELLDNYLKDNPIEMKQPEVESMDGEFVIVEKKNAEEKLDAEAAEELDEEEDEEADEELDEEEDEEADEELEKEAETQNFTQEQMDTSNALPYQSPSPR